MTGGPADTPAPEKVFSYNGPALGPVLCANDGRVIVLEPSELAEDGPARWVHAEDRGRWCYSSDWPDRTGMSSAESMAACPAHPSPETDQDAAAADELAAAWREAPGDMAAAAAAESAARELADARIVLARREQALEKHRGQLGAAAARVAQAEHNVAAASLVLSDIEAAQPAAPAAGGPPATVGEVAGWAMAQRDHYAELSRGMHSPAGRDTLAACAAIMADVVRFCRDGEVVR